MLATHVIVSLTVWKCIEERIVAGSQIKKQGMLGSAAESACDFDTLHICRHLAGITSGKSYCCCGVDVNKNGAVLTVLGPFYYKSVSQPDRRPPVHDCASKVTPWHSTASQYDVCLIERITSMSSEPSLRKLLHSASTRPLKGLLCFVWPTGIYVEPFILKTLFNCCLTV